MDETTPERPGAQEGQPVLTTVSNPRRVRL
jgi:hypothetical protein